MSKPKINVYWFRKALRLHDNAPLLEASKSKHPLLPIFILDPLFLPDTRADYDDELASGALAGENQFQFLMECLQDLNENLKSMNSQLCVFLAQNPEEVFEQILKEFDVDSLYYEKDSEPYANERDAKIENLFKENSTKTVSAWGQTLTDLDEIKSHFKKTPKVYRSFMKVMGNHGDEIIVKPCEAVKSVPCLPKNLGNLQIFDGIPTMKEIGFPKKHEHTPFFGGETAALERMEKKLADKKWIAKFEKPKTSPATLEASTTVLSPYFALGCLSVRLFHFKVQKVYESQKSHAKPPMSLHGQLYFREWFYYLSYTIPNFHQMKGNPLCLQVDWDHNKEFIEKWHHGQTGFPWIDAIMRKLRQEGWIHHLARHSAACFLTRGQLWQNWEEGKKIFAMYLLDGDYALNSANWMWLSASAFFNSYYRVYGTESFPKKYDKSAKMVRKYCPELAKFPDKYIYCPWEAPKSVQKLAGCVIGEDYPDRIVDEKTAKQENMAKMKAAYKRKIRGNPNSVELKKRGEKRKEAPKVERKTKKKRFGKKKIES